MNKNELPSTSGDIRRLLAETMYQVRSGEVAPSVGLTIAALSKALTDNMQVEINIHKVNILLLGSGRRIAEATEMGKFLIGENSQAIEKK